MAYEVLALKYRPRVFEDLVGQEATSRTLTNAIQQGRIAHAFLFAGVRGVGKTTTARILAKALNCASGPTVRPCGECAACKEIAAGRSMDVLEIDGASHTKVEEFRELLDTVQYAPSRDRFKIYIVDEVHMLSTHSFNALLKTLEEPPAHVKFIFATTEQHKIPDTIRSRCQEFEFRTVAPAEIGAQLQKIAEAEGIEIDPAAVAAIARVAAGSLRDGVSALDQVIAASGKAVTAIKESDVTELLGLIEREVLRDTVRAIVARDARAILATVDRLVKGGRDLRYFTSALMQYLRDVLVVRVAPHAVELIEVPDDRPDLEALAQSLTEEDLVRALNVLADAELALRTSPEPRFHLEVSLLKLSQLGRLASFEELLERFEALATGKTFSAPPSASTPSSSPLPSSSSSSSSTSSSPASGSPRTSSVRASSAPPEPPEPEPEAEPEPEVELGASSSPEATGALPQLIEKLKTSKPMLHAVVARHRSATFDEDQARLTLVFEAEHNGIASQLERDGHLHSMLVEQLTDVCGRPASVVVEIEAADDDRESESESPKQDTPTLEKPSTDALRARAEQDPLVRQFVETFQGEVEDVRATEPS